MANPSMTNPSMTHAKESVREAVREPLREVSRTASEYYDQASHWIQENNRWLGLAGVVLAAGVIGFFWGRGMRYGESPRSYVSERD